MTTTEIKDALKAIADQCDESREQLAINGALRGLSSAICSGRQIAFFMHASEFTEADLPYIQMMAARERASRN